MKEKLLHLFTAILALKFYPYHMKFFFPIYLSFSETLTSDFPYNFVNMLQQVILP